MGIGIPNSSVVVGSCSVSVFEDEGEAGIVVEGSRTAVDIAVLSDAEDEGEDTAVLALLCAGGEEALSVSLDPFPPAPGHWNTGFMAPPTPPVGTGARVTEPEGRGGGSVVELPAEGGMEVGRMELPVVARGAVGNTVLLVGRGAVGPKAIVVLLVGTGKGGLESLDVKMGVWVTVGVTMTVSMIV